MKQNVVFTLLMIMLITVLGCSEKVWAYTPEKIIELKQIDADEDMIEVSWKATGADSYIVQYSANDTDWTKAVGEATCKNNKISIYNRVAGMTYYVRVKGVYNIEEDDQDSISNNTYESEWSDIIDVVTTPKKNIKIVQTGATKTSASFKWDSVAGATSYNIYKKSAGITQFYKNVTATKVNVTGLGSNKKTDVVVAPVRISSTGFSTECYNIITSSEIKLQPGKITEITMSAYNSSKKKAVIIYDKQEGTSGADIEVYDYKGKKLVWKGTTTYATKEIPKIKANSFYKIRMRAFTKIAGKKKYGTWSNYMFIGNQIVVNLKMKFDKINASWDSYKGASSYDVYASSDNVTYKKVKSVKGTSCKISKIAGKKVKSGKNYYVYVVANKKVNKKVWKSMVKNSFFLLVK